MTQNTVSLLQCLSHHHAFASAFVHLFSVSVFNGLCLSVLSLFITPSGDVCLAPVITRTSLSTEGDEM